MDYESVTKPLACSGGAVSSPCQTDVDLAQEIVLRRPPFGP
jgi:hypothetical protein